MANSVDVRHAVFEFAALIPSLAEPDWFSHRTIDVKDRRAVRKQPWYSSAGIYCFYSGTGELRYIGRALSGVGLGARVPDHLRDACRGDADWDKVLDDDAASVDVCALNSEDHFWAPSLELFLCDRFPGLVNRRRS